MTTRARSTKSTYRLSALLALGCIACVPEQADDRPLGQRLGDIKNDLMIGSTGNEVRALHDYLTRFGYFPNTELAKAHPRWRAPISTTPIDAAVFDRRTADAVRLLQHNSGLEPTGVVNATLRTLLATPRCGVPDNEVELDPTDKWAPDDTIGHSAGVHFVTNLKLVGTSFGNLGQAGLTTAATNAARTWMQQTSLIVTLPGPVDFGDAIGLAFGSLDSSTLASTDSNRLITFNNQITWSNATPTPMGAFDLESVALHEMAHALGLGHSAWNQAVMTPGLSVQTQKRVPDGDDNVGISSFWDTYWQTPGAALDIGVSGGTNGEVWVVGTDNRIYRWNGTSWTQDRNNRLALRIAVDPSGNPWVVDSANHLWQGTTNDPATLSWVDRMPSALDVGIGANGDIWIVGGDSTARKFNPANGVVQPIGVALSVRRISVSPMGRPWVVTLANEVQRWSSNNPLSGGWVNTSGTAGDVGIGPTQLPFDPAAPLGKDGAAFKVVQGSGLLVWDEQPGSDSFWDRLFDGSHIPLSASWRLAGYGRGSVRLDEFGFPPGGTNVAVGPNGKPWVVGANGAIFTTVR